VFDAGSKFIEEKRGREQTYGFLMDTNATGPTGSVWSSAPRITGRWPRIVERGQIFCKRGISGKKKYGQSTQSRMAHVKGKKRQLKQEEGGTTG